MRSTRLAAAAGLVGAVLLVGASPAVAHVTIPDPAPQGGFGIVTLSVPNERDDASTVTVEVQVPQDHPLAFVSVQPKPGWTATTTTRTLDEPIESEEGGQITEVVDTVTWTGGEIGPGEFDTFSLSVGPLPSDVDELGFPTIQTYSDGDEVAWIEDTPASGEEPESPTPVLHLVAATDDDHTHGDDGDDDDTATPPVDDAGDDAGGSDGLAVAALVVGALGLVAGLGAITMARRPRP
jgi:uncharacterized protein YcnI